MANFRSLINQRCSHITLNLVTWIQSMYNPRPKRLSSLCPNLKSIVFNPKIWTKGWCYNLRLPTMIKLFIADKMEVPSPNRFLFFERGIMEAIIWIIFAVFTSIVFRNVYARKFWIFKIFLKETPVPHGLTLGG